MAKSMTLSAVAIAPGQSPSAVATATYTINLPSAATPTFSLTPGTYTTVETVALNDSTPGTVIYYTTDGSAATPSSQLYTAPIPIGVTETVNAIAVAAGYNNSAVASAVYTINLPAPTPAISTSTGSTNTVFGTPLLVTITDADANATIYYAIGSASGTNATRYTGPISVSLPETINAVAVDPAGGLSQSGQASLSLTVTEATPTFSQKAGTIAYGSQVGIGDLDPAATIYYTIGTTPPTTASAVYTGPITVNSNETINAIAVNSANQLQPSTAASASYAIPNPTPTPAISTAGGTIATYPSVLPVSIGDADGSATIYYTTDGSTPSSSHGTPYSGPLTVSQTETVSAVAIDVAGGNPPSSVAAQLLTVMEATPSISPAAGSVVPGTQVTIADADPGATIYYTTDGNPATTASTRYTGAIPLNGSATINAIAIDTAAGTNYTQSQEASAIYTVQAPAPTIVAAGGTSTTYPATLPVTINDSDSTATIYYTTDGSAPSATHGTLYSGAFSVSSTETVTAIATDASHGYANSTTSSQAFSVVEATPQISPPAGTVPSNTQITIADADPGATIYYTTNGSPASTSSTRYTGAFTLSATETINAIAIDMATGTNYTQSQETTAAYTLQSPAPTPAIASAGGTSTTYPATLSVTITDGDATAAIYYTTDGSTPSATHGTPYSGAFAVSSTETVSAIAIDSSHGYANSAISSQLFTVVEATPTISPAAGTVASGTQVTIADADPGATIYYTTNGSPATTGSTRYTGAITVSSSETINAIAIDTAAGANYVQSQNASATYTLQAPTPSIASAGGTSTTYPATFPVTIGDSDATATIYYTTDGSAPSATHGTRYSGAFAVTSTETVTAIATDASHGYANSATSSQTFTVVEATPQIAPAAGTVASGTQVTIADADPGATIYYTTNGSQASTGSTRYTGPITLNSSETINAIAIDTGAGTNYTQSQDVSAAYSLLSAAPTPAILSAGGTSTTYPGTFSVTITDSDATATIYYTTDGSGPSQTHGTQYSGAFPVSSTEVVTAIAVDSSHGYTNSPTASQQFTVIEATPSISPAAGTVASGTQVTITDADAGATIYYTTNGNQATTSSTRYTGAITLTASETINAIAIDTTAGTNYTQSQDASAAYTLQPPAPTPTIASVGGTSTTYPATFSVTISDSDSTATIYYTTDGSAPSATHGTPYSGAFTVSSTETVTAIATDTSHGYGYSVTSSQLFTVVEATPQISPAAGTVASGKQVTITDADPGATIYYTTNGNQATTSSTRYTGAITLTASETINAIAIDTAVGTNYVQSQNESQAYTVQAPTPAIVSAGGTSTTYPATLSVTISDSDSTATIYYTTDGSAPSATHGTPYSGAFTVSSTETVTAIATDTSHGYGYSVTSSQLFTVVEATPQISPAAGTVASGTQVTITDADPGATIYYTTNGNQATTSSTRYTAAIAVSATETINAIAIDTAAGANYTQSQDASAAYVVQGATPTPTISTAGGTSATYPSTLSVTIGDSDSTATIYYTTDGSTPSATNGTTYSGAIAVSSTETIKALATDTAAGTTDSSVASQLFTIVEATPSFSPVAGLISAGSQVTIADADPGATIYYTTNGNPATTSSTHYTGAIPVSTSETINAIAVDTAAGASYTQSQDASAAYTIYAGRTISGSMTSGSLPVIGATVHLYAAGTTGYAKGAKTLTTVPASITTSASGGFSLGYTCPAAPGDQLYLVATGGSTVSGATVPGIALMVTLGSCGKLPASASVTINEVTTVASAYALSGFAAVNSGGGIVVGAPAPNTTCVKSGLSTLGKSTCNYPGLVNAFRTVTNLVNTATGIPLTITEFYSGSDPNNLNGFSSSYGDPSGKCPGATCLSPDNPVPSVATNTSTVPYQRLNTLGNLLASCVEASGNCVGLSSLTGGSGDTLQSALYIAQHPGAWSGTAGLYGWITSPSVPYTPPYGNASTTLSAEPNDWTLAIGFTGAGLGIDPQTDPADYLDNQTLAVDVNGNVWATAAALSSDLGGVNPTGNAVGTLAGFDPLGEALTPPTTLVSGAIAYDGANGYTSYGGYGPDVSLGSGGVGLFGQPNSIAIDAAQHLWVSNQGAPGQYDPGGSELTISKTAAPGAAKNLTLSALSPSLNLADDGTSMAVDSANYLWQSAGPLELWQFDSTGTNDAIVPLTLTSATSGNVQSICNFAFDVTGTLWADDCGTPGNGGQVFAIAPDTGTLLATYSGALTAPSQGGTLAAGSSGNVFACNSSQTGYLVFNTSNLVAPVKTFSTSNGRCGQFLTVDGAGQVWSYGATSSGPALDAVNGNGQQITPNKGLTGISSDEVAATGLTTFNQTASNGQGGIAVDGSGNLWFLNGVAGTLDVTTTPANALVEFIGVAAPTVNPAAVAAQNSAQGTKP